jgi:hypothetical protein
MSLFDKSDVDAFRCDRLVAALGTYMPEVTLSDDYVLESLQAAEAEVAHLLKVFLEPTVIFPYEPTSDEITALGAMPYAEEPGYDYDAGFFQGERWGYIVTRARPIISVEYIRLSYPNPTATFYTIPHDWLRLDKKYGHIRMVPASAGFTAPLGAFVMQALGGGTTIPSMIQVKYTAGLTNVKSDPKWADLRGVIKKSAALRILEGAFLPQSGSISADGLSQSLNIDLSKYRDSVNLSLFGPEGSNGGLWTTIHGVVMSAAGVLA